jgi:SpoVK/Ycf46/Vps4 family AAA+-type ATPase
VVPLISLLVGNLAYQDLRTQRRLVQDDFAKAAQECKPRSLRDVKLQSSQIAWSDIGGMC